MTDTEQQYENRIIDSFGVCKDCIIDYELTNILYKNKDKISEAIKLGLECVKNYPDNEFFLTFLGFAYNLNESFEKSLECALKRVSVYPDNPYNWIDLSFACRSNGEIIISDWINFNLELFMHYYRTLDFKEFSHENLMKILHEIKNKAQKP